MRRRILVVAAVLVAVSVVVVSWLTQTGPWPGFSWQTGKLYRYRLSHTGNTAIRPLMGVAGSRLEAQQALASALEVELTLELRAYPRHGDNFVLGLRIPTCRRAQFAIAGQQVWKSGADCEADLRGVELVLELAPNGELRTLHSQPDAPEMFVYIAHYLVGEIQVVAEKGDGPWTAEEPTFLGTAQSSYEAWSQVERHWRTTRSRARYAELKAAALLTDPPLQTVSSEHVIELTGHIVSLTGREEVEARSEADHEPFLRSATTIDMALESITDFTSPAPSLAALVGREPGVVPTSAGAEERLLEQQTAGLTLEQLKEAIALYAASGKFPDHNRFLWRINGLLRLHPEYCKQLIPLFMSDGANSKARALILDILASAGHAEAQAVMRELLASAVAQQNPLYPYLMQRTGFVEEPDAETGNFVRDAYRAGVAGGDDNMRLSSAYTMGSVADHLRASNEHALADALSDELAEGLRNAPNDVEVVHFINALDNAERDGDIDLLAGFAEHEDADVRMAVASSMGTPPTDRAGEILLQLMGDQNRLVQKQALRAFRNHTLTADHMTAFVRLIEAGNLQDNNVRVLLEIIKSYRTRLPQPTIGVLQSLQRARLGDNQVRAAIIRLLQSG